MKRVIAALLCGVMTLGLMTGCGGEGGDDAAKVINVWSFTDEVPGMIEKYKELHPDFDYEINTTIIATTDGAYQPALDAALQGGGADAPDIYAAEAAFILKYAQGDAASYAATYKDLGIDVDAKIAEADIAKYSVEIGTRPSDNAVVALGYQATGGAFIYRRSIAKDVWGTDDPAAIGEKLGAGSGNWDKFWAAAEELKAKDYAIISGDGDMWHAVENSSSQGWIVDNKLVIDPKREAFIDYSMKLKENGYHHDTQDWTDAWYADMKLEGGVLGFFGPAWLVNYTIGANCGTDDEGNNSFGDWAVCASPVGFFWGGTWVLANKDVVGSDKQEVVADIIEWITLDSSDTGLQYMWANGTYNPESGTKDSVASGTVMAKSNGEVAFLGGQNMFEAFIPANQYASGKCLTQYDESINTIWRDQVRAYTAGTKTREQAIADFKQTVADTFTTITVE